MAKDTPGTELAKLPDPMESAAMLLRGEGLDAADADLVTESIVMRILAAESIDDVFGEIPTWSTKDSIGVAFTVNDLRVFRSTASKDKESGFVACDAHNLATGERGILTTGAAKIAAKLLWLKNHDALPINVRVVELSKAASGFNPLDIERVN